MIDPYLDLPNVVARTTLSPSTIYRRIKDGSFRLRRGSASTASDGANRPSRLGRIAISPSSRPSSLGVS